MFDIFEKNPLTEEEKRILKALREEDKQSSREVVGRGALISTPSDITGSKDFKEQARRVKSLIR